MAQSTEAKQRKALASLVGRLADQMSRGEGPSSAQRQEFNTLKRALGETTGFI